AVLSKFPGRFEISSWAFPIMLEIIITRICSGAVWRCFVCANSQLSQLQFNVADRFRLWHRFSGPLQRANNIRIGDFYVAGKICAQGNDSKIKLLCVSRINVKNMPHPPESLAAMPTARIRAENLAV